MTITKITKIVLCVLVFAYSVQAFSQCSYQIPIFKTDKLNKSNYSLLDSLKHKNKKKNNDGLFFGVNLGFYKANNYTAQYYNGSGTNKLNDSLLFSYNNVQNIKNALGTDTFNLGYLPSKMKYAPAMMIGLFLKYNINNSSFFFQFNYCKLKANDVFTILLLDTNTNTITFPKQESISGSEQRTNIDIGYCYNFTHNKNYIPYIECGFNINDTKFIYNKIKIENLEINLVNQWILYYNIIQGGIGTGVFLGGGINFVFNESVSVIPGFDIYYTKTKLGNFDQLKLNYSAFVKVILNGLL